jgi:hypothetical protein
MVLTTDNFDSRGGGKADTDEEEVAEEAPVKESPDDSAVIVKALEKIESAQKAAEKVASKLGRKDVVLGVQRQREDIVAGIAKEKKKG